MNRYTGYTIEEVKSLKPNNSRLTPIRFGETVQFKSGKRRTLVCICDCGKEHTLDVTYFIKGKTLSCGCYNRDKNEALFGMTLEYIQENIPKESNLSVIEYVKDYTFPSGQRTKIYKFLCRCGNVFATSASRVLSSNTKSCGCAQKKYPQNRRKIQVVYFNMINRCYSPNHFSYCFYGAKGVVVCEEWRQPGGFNKFYEWAIKSGWHPNLQIDKDILGDGKLYSPDTCMWVTAEVNTNNRGVTRRFKYRGILYSTRELCNKFNVEYSHLFGRLCSGMDVEEAVKRSRGSKKRRLWSKRYKKSKI